MYRTTPFLPPETEYDDIDKLNQDRHANDMRLKSTFESIFAKYERDFTDIGDEIDLETGKVVVDNGHLRDMEDEGDTGESQAAQFLRAYTEEMSDAEDGDEEVSGSGSEADPEGDKDEVRQTQSATDEGANDDELAMESAAENNSQTLLPPASKPEQLQSIASLPTTAAPMAPPPQPANTDVAAMAAMLQSSMQSFKQQMMSEFAQLMQQNRQNDSKDDVWRAPPLPVVPRAVRPTSQLPGFGDRMSQTPGPSRSIWATPTAGRPLGSKNRAHSVRPRQVSSNSRSGHETPYRSLGSSARRAPGGVLNAPKLFPGSHRYDAVNTAPDEDQALRELDDAVDSDEDPIVAMTTSADRVTLTPNSKRSISGQQNIKKGLLYTQEDDEQIIRLREEEGTDWHKIAALLGRPKKSVTNRYYNRLSIRARPRSPIREQEMPVTSLSPSQGTRASISTSGIQPNGQPLKRESPPPESGNAADAPDEVGDRALHPSVESDPPSADKPQVLFVPDSQTGDEQLSSSNPASSFQQDTTVTRDQVTRMQTELQEPQASVEGHEIVIQVENGPEQENLEDPDEVASAQSKKRKNLHQTSASEDSEISLSTEAKRRRMLPASKDLDAVVNAVNRQDEVQDDSRSSKQKSPRVVIPARKRSRSIEEVTNHTDAEGILFKHPEPEHQDCTAAPWVRQRRANGKFLGKSSKYFRGHHEPRAKAVTGAVSETVEEDDSVHKPTTGPTPSHPPIPSVVTRNAPTSMPPPPPPPHTSKAKPKFGAIAPPTIETPGSAQKQDRTSTPTAKPVPLTPSTPASGAKAIDFMLPPSTPGIRASTPKPTVTNPILGKLRPGTLLFNSPLSAIKSSTRRRTTMQTRASLDAIPFPDELEKSSPAVVHRSSSRAPSRRSTPSNKPAAGSAQKNVHSGRKLKPGQTTISQIVKSDSDGEDDPLSFTKYLF
ncbi:hypothetical protein K490DRAFT_64843 [Saccharata proteae CBS 121410]|uniref:Myb-like domain-containing protein n=1 Tax=Saccharata proteae CBS 121410 TaxID=1314787 RepID=A0A9P4LZJ4_9PEZI|nr:hypothetical protein K490DRAFT_64843 [Saccharata proteae CBS 121410]